jgi:hypothetical protein
MDRPEIKPYSSICSNRQYLDLGHKRDRGRELLLKIHLVTNLLAHFQIGEMQGATLSKVSGKYLP